MARIGGVGVIDIRPLAPADMPALERLFGTTRGTAGCWCMWYIISVKEFHAGGAAANAAKFRALAAASPLPMGLLAWIDGEPAGWAAAGPRSRYARAVNTPTLKAADPAEHDAVWLVPCFYVRADRRRGGIARALLEAAVDAARTAGAVAIEGFPTAGTRLGSTDRHVGTEVLFRSCGFTPVDRPSSNRVVMRRELGAAR